MESLSCEYNLRDEGSKYKRYIFYFLYILCRHLYFNFYVLFLYIFLYFLYILCILIYFLFILF